MKMVHLAGKRTTETIHRENGVRLKLDVERVYFSARTSTERKRVSDMVKPGERVLVMFSGCAPYPCVISKNSEAEMIVGVEINPEGHRYGLENVKMNRLDNVQLYCGDVRKVVPGLGKFDRIVMPLPHTAEEFLDVALSASRSGTVIHFYTFLEEEGIPDVGVKKFSDACADFKVLSWNKCGQFSPNTFRVCIDLRIV